MHRMKRTGELNAKSVLVKNKPGQLAVQEVFQRYMHNITAEVDGAVDAAHVICKRMPVIEYRTYGNEIIKILLIKLKCILSGEKSIYDIYSLAQLQNPKLSAQDGADVLEMSTNILECFFENFYLLEAVMNDKSTDRALIEKFHTVRSLCFALCREVDDSIKMEFGVANGSVNVKTFRRYTEQLFLATGQEVLNRTDQLLASLDSNVAKRFSVDKRAADVFELFVEAKLPLAVRLVGSRSRDRDFVPLLENVSSSIRIGSFREHNFPSMEKAHEAYKELYKALVDAAYQNVKILRSASVEDSSDDEKQQIEELRIERISNCATETTELFIHVETFFTESRNRCEMLIDTAITQAQAREQAPGGHILTPAGQEAALGGSCDHDQQQNRTVHRLRSD